MSTSKQLDPATRNNDIGLYWEKCRRVDPAGAGLPFVIGELATGLISGVANTVVVKNSISGETNVVPFEAGEWKPIVFDQVLVGATIDGVAETTTTATGMFWTTSPANIGKDT